MKKLVYAALLTPVLGTAHWASANEGLDTYKRACFMCHDAAVAGAPKLGDKAAWAPRIGQGIDTLVATVISGKNAMPPRGTCMDCSDDDLRAGVNYMLGALEGASAEAAPTAQQEVAQAVTPVAAEEASSTDKVAVEANAEPTAAASEPEPATAEETPAASATAEAQGLRPGNADVGGTKAAACLACHGPNGNSVNPIWPKLAGQHAAYLEKQIRSFKSGERVNVLMAPMVAPLGEQDILDIAAHFSIQKTSDGQGNPELAQQGAALYRAGKRGVRMTACIACHGPTGRGNPAAGFPSLRSQHAAYAAQALRDYRDGKRSNDLNAMMRGVAKGLSDDEVVALAEYVATLK